MSDLRENATHAPSGPPTSIALATGQTVDLSFIPDAQRTALMAEYMRGTIDIARKANELHVDVVTYGIRSGHSLRPPDRSPRMVTLSPLLIRSRRR